MIWSCHGIFRDFSLQMKAGAPGMVTPLGLPGTLPIGDAPSLKNAKAGKGLTSSFNLEREGDRTASSCLLQIY
jgi:hypothetical protein